MSFVSVSVTSDPVVILDGSIDQLNGTLATAGMPGWTAADATMAVLVLAAAAQIMADATQVSAVCLPAVFRAFGTQLFGVPYTNGAQASVTSTWTFTSPAPTGGYTIDQGLTVFIDGQAFYTQTSTTTATSATTASITLVASQVGAAYNDLGAVDETLDLQDGIDWVATVIALGVTSGGADQESDSDYQDRLVAELALQAPRPVVDADFAAFVLSDIALNATGVAVGRATAIDGFYPAPRVLSTGGAGSTVVVCSVSSGQPTVTINTPLTNQVPTVGATVTGASIPGGTTILGTPAPTPAGFTMSANASGTVATDSLTIGALSGYGPPSLTCTGNLSSGSPTATITAAPWLGMIPYPTAAVTGPGVPASTTVLASPAPTAAGFTMSNNASSNETAQTFTISEWTSVQLADCVAVTDDSGNALTAAEMDALLSWLETYRPTNWLVNVVAATYSPVYVTTLVAVLPTYDQTAVGTNVQAALLNWLNQETYGNPGGATSGTTAWLTAQQGWGLIRFKQAIQIAGSVPGVAYVDTLTLGLSPSPAGTSDVVINGGPFPLPTSTAGTINGVGSAGTINVTTEALP